MNAFALLLLAFPFYLMTKGRLTVYIALASSKAAAPAAGSASASTQSLNIPSVTTEQPIQEEV